MLFFNASVIERAIEPPKVRHHLRHHGLHLHGLCHIGLNEHGLRPQRLYLAHGFFARPSVAVRHRQLCARACKRQRTGPTNTTTATCHQDHLVVEIELG